MTNKSSSILVMFLIVGFFSVNFTHDAYACSCIEITELQALEKSFVSFVGTPIKIESPSGFNNIVTFHIERPIKNIAEDTIEVTIITSTQESACGYNFEGNTRYLVNTYGEKPISYLVKDDNTTYTLQKAHHEGCLLGIQTGQEVLEQVDG